jgi:two-component system sensor kinase
MRKPGLRVNLHDDLGQSLTALKMNIASVGAALNGLADTSMRAQLQGLRRLIDTTVASVRRIALDLRPVILDDLGLVAAIE